MATLILGILIFSGVFLIISIRSIHCPYWQLPMGASFLLGATVLTLVFPISWPAAGLCWLGSVIAASLAVIIRNYLEKKS